MNETNTKIFNYIIALFFLYSFAHGLFARLYICKFIHLLHLPFRMCTFTGCFTGSWEEFYAMFEASTANIMDMPNIGLYNEKFSDFNDNDLKIYHKFRAPK